jgi:hypothetical protein
MTSLPIDCPSGEFPCSSADVPLWVRTADGDILIETSEFPGFKRQALQAGVSRLRLLKAAETDHGGIFFEYQGQDPFHRHQPEAGLAQDRWNGR